MSKTDRDKALEALENLNKFIQRPNENPIEENEFNKLEEVYTYFKAALQEPVVDVEEAEQSFVVKGRLSETDKKLFQSQFSGGVVYAEPYPAQEWQGIESAPKDGSLILVGFHSNDGWWNCDCSRWEDDGWWQHRQNQPTHWMPLPNSPKGASE